MWKKHQNLHHGATMMPLVSQGMGLQYGKTPSGQSQVCCLLVLQFALEMRQQCISERSRGAKTGTLDSGASVLICRL